MTEPTSGTMLSRFVYDEIRARIIDGRLAAGEPLRERDLAAELQVSRVPIREALPALEQAGFVTVLPRRSAVVTRIRERDVEELYDLRAVLEPLVARKAAVAVAAGRPGDAIAEALRSADAALSAGDYDALMRSNSAFHAAIEALAGNALLTTTMAPLHDRSARLNVATRVSDPGARHDEHRGLGEAILAGNHDLAAALAFAHVELGRRRTFATLSEVPGFRPEQAHHAGPDAPR